MSLLDTVDVPSRRIMAASGRAEVVLVVEDEPFIAMDIDEVLRAAGLTVELRSSRSDALKWLENRSPATAVLDLHLRDGDGLAIAAVLQSRGVPVIFCSGGDPSDLPKDFKTAAWVRKPFVYGELVTEVRRAIETCEFQQQIEQRA
ncbi:response regulator [Rhizobium sp. Leaf391]|uniref:response regulator n=1 Tax=Rhizobium sp. Leaf391 TaxID=1736360 RepID=UPI000B213010|nr:response regulator [Rhizobium sp. Leaf391]